MAKLATLFALGGLMFATISCAAHPSVAGEKAGPGVAVVELFTSEGCSSCPPADAAAADLIKSSAGQPVYVLAFHVDYWNDLGWTDPFSAAAYTQRQNNYARAMRLDAVYTPQAIVNGRQEFVGSNRDTLTAAVATAEKTPATGTLALTIDRSGPAVHVKAAGSGLSGGVVVNFALVERGISVRVPRGENGGRTLTHENVVRSFASPTPDAAGNASATLTLPTGAMQGDLSQFSVIAYAQRVADGQVLAATDSVLNRPATSHE